MVWCTTVVLQCLAAFGFETREHLCEGLDHLARQLVVQFK